MPDDRLHDPGAALRRAAARPRTPVDADAVLARGASLKRRRAAARAVVALLVAVPATAAALTWLPTAGVDVTGPPDAGTVPATLSADEEPPATLADGSTPPAVPASVVSRFDRPVVATRRGAALPPYLDPLCDTGPADTLHGALLERTGPRVVHVGPAAATALAVGSAESPPPYPDEFGVACLVSSGGAGGGVLTHVYGGYTANLQEGAAGGRDLSWWMTALRVPSGAAWAVQEQRGWWLAYDVEDVRWLLAPSSEEVPAGTSPDETGFPGLRVVYLDALGAVVGEERMGREAITDDAPFLGAQTAQARIRFPDEAALRGDLADGPVAACADEVTVCVWLVDDDGTIVALSAAGPLPDEVPPLGWVGWCPSTGSFQGAATASAYAEDGAWLAGPSQTGLHRYEVHREDGGVVVDLSRFSFGAERSAQRQAVQACDDLLDPGFPAP